MSDKVKVGDIAKKYGLTAKAILLMVKGMGHDDIKSHNSVLGDDVLAKIEKRFEHDKRQAKDDIKNKDRLVAMNKTSGSESHGDPKEQVAPSSGVADKESLDHAREVKIAEKQVEKKVEEGQPKPENDSSKNQKDTKKHGKKGRFFNKKREVVVDDKLVDSNIKKTLNKVVKPGSRRKYRKEREEEVTVSENILRVTEGITAADLSKLMKVTVTEIIGKCLELGLMVTINQRLSFDIIEMVADEYDYRVEVAEEYKENNQNEQSEDEKIDESNLKGRCPVVTIMGHVDHGKTSLLDYIRKSNVVKGESGGITQHIGAYQVHTKDGDITFIDTPGHEAFTAMRSRGANVTDIVVIVVAADSRVMPQTIEAISHAKAASVPMIIAINKCDLPNIKIDGIKRELSENDILVEDWGGKYQCVEISAVTGKNIDVLLEKILIESEMLELKADPERPVVGMILESRLNKGIGPVGTVLIQHGTLKVGQPFLAGHIFGKVRMMLDDKGDKLKVAGPSTPVQIVGFEEVPHAGDKFKVMCSEKEAKDMATKRKHAIKEKERQIAVKGTASTLEELYSKIQSGETQLLNIIIKGDVDGSIEAMSDSLEKLSNDEVRINVIHKAVGEIKESDVLLATTSGAVIVGFHVRPSAKARELARQENIEIKSYNIIYEVIDDVKKALQGLLRPEIVENVTGEIEVREVFKISKVGTVAGCYVRSGHIYRNHKVRIVRNGIVVHEGEVLALKRFKDDVKDVREGFECGVSIKNYDDIKVGDLFEFFEIKEIARKLDK